MLGKLSHQNLHYLAKRYGPIMSVRLGYVPAIVVSSPQAAELFLKTHDVVFASRPKVQASEYLSYDTKGIAFTEYGSYWRTVRKWCTLHLLGASKVEYFARKAELGSLVESVKKAAAARETVDLSRKVGELIEEISCKIIFGRSKDDRFNLKQLIEEAMYLSGAFNLSDYLPYLASLDLQGLARRLKRTSKVLDTFFEKIIDEHGQGTNPVAVDQKPQRFRCCDASYDTSATAIVWTFSELLRHPRVMFGLQQELETVVGRNRMVEESDLPKLTYLDKKSRIMVNTWSMARDPNLWSENAEEFFPDRFIDSNIDPRGHDFQLIPFGSGRRGCPGMQLGQITIRLVLAQLVHCFDWELPDGMLPNELGMSEKFGFSLPGANHLFTKPTYRLLDKRK
ncbi:hypothetical protein CRYUN_Cryun13aG0064700 [Craigia yunnanensis]